MTSEKNLDTLKYDLELDKFHWQQKTYRKDNTLRRHFGVIITAIVSFAAIVVSYLQLSISSNNAKAQIENERLKNDRQFSFEISKFLLDREQEITTSDLTKVLYLRNVVISSFPPDVAAQIASRMRDTSSTNDMRKIWDDGLTYLKATEVPGKAYKLTPPTVATEDKRCTADPLIAPSDCPRWTAPARGKHN